MRLTEMLRPSRRLRTQRRGNGGSGRGSMSMVIYFISLLVLISAFVIYDPSFAGAGTGYTETLTYTGNAASPAALASGDTVTVTGDEQPAVIFTGSADAELQGVKLSAGGKFGTNNKGAILVKNGSAARIASSDIAADGQNGIGITVDSRPFFSSSYSSVDIVDTNISGKNKSTGIMVHDNSSVTVKNSSIKVQNCGIDITGSGKNNLLNVERSTIVVSGDGTDGGVGVNLLSCGGKSTIKSSDITVNGGGYAMSGVYASGTRYYQDGSDNDKLKEYSADVRVHNAVNIEDSKINVKGNDNETGFAVNVTDNACVNIKNSIITTEGQQKYGVEVYLGSSADIAGTTINARGTNSHAVFVSNYGWADLNPRSSATIKDSAIVTSGDWANGVFLRDNSHADLDNVNITTNGGATDTSYGLYAYANSTLKAKNVDITTAGGKEFFGVCAEDVSSADITDSKIKTSGAAAHGVYAGDNSNVSVGNTAIMTSGNDSYGVYAYLKSKAKAVSADIATSGINSSGAAALTDSRLDVADSIIKTSGEGSHGIFADSSDVTISNSVVKVSKDGTAAFWLERGSVVTADNLTASGPLLLFTTSSGTMTASNSKLTGNIAHAATTQASAPMDVTLKGGTYWNGAAAARRDITAAKINLDIDATSAWNITGSSYTNGRLANAGLIDFREESANSSERDSNAPAYKALEAADYVGNGGTIVMRSDIDAGTGDKLVAKKVEGATMITVIPSGPASASRSAALITAETDKGALFSLNGGKAAAGAWYYGLADGTDVSGKKEWYLKRGEGKPEEPGDKYLTSTGWGIASALVLPTVWQTEANALYSRMGIYSDGKYNGGLWFTGSYSKTDYDMGKTNSLVDGQKFTSGTIGYDKKIRTGNGNWWTGLMAGYGKADRDLSYGLGDSGIDSFHASLYGIYRADSGLYAAGLIKYNRYSTDYTITHPDSYTREVLGFDRVKGDYAQNGIGASLQAGRRIDFKNSDGWYWEPQLQLSWYRISAADYATNSGIHVNVDSSNYIRARGGVELGRTWTLENGTLLNLHGDLSYAREFDGETDVWMDGGKYTHKSDLGGGMAIIGVGGNWKYGVGKYLTFRMQHIAGTACNNPFSGYLGFSFEM